MADSTVVQLYYLAHELQNISEQLGYAEKLKNSGRDNPAYQIVMKAAEQLLPVFRAHSPVLTGLLKESHFIANSGIAGLSDGVEAWAEIGINPNTRENDILGGYPRDYGPKYHAERRPWFLEAEAEAQPLFDVLAEAEFDIWLEIWAF